MEQWSSRAAFILAAIGSAVGIGNIWRFSSVLGQNGGGAYLVPFLIAVFFCALPLMILEFSMGRHFQGTIVSAFRAVRPQFHILGWLLCGAVSLVLAYYLVITGWTLGYFFFSLGRETISFSDFTTGWLPVVLFAVTTAATGIVVSRGIRAGIERLSLFLIPVSIGILIILAVYGTTLPGFAEGMGFLFTPDFSVLGDPLLWSAAFGQAFFSLSVGTGILLTYGAHIDRGQGVPVSSLIVTFADVAVALLAGMVIFPIVFTFGLVPTIGAELAFTTLPQAFAVMPFGWLIAAAFFMVLFFAALTSAVSMLEVSVAAVSESVSWSRLRTSALLTGLVFIAGLPSALSYSALDLRVEGVRVLDFMDETIGTLGLPVTALLLAIVFTWFVPKDTLAGETGSGIARLVHPICRFVIPVVLLLITGARLVSGLDYPGLRMLPGSEFIGTLLQAESIILIFVLILLLIVGVCRLRRCPLAKRFRTGK